MPRKHKSQTQRYRRDRAVDTQRFPEESLAVDVIDLTACDDLAAAGEEYGTGRRRAEKDVSGESLILRSLLKKG